MNRSLALMLLVAIGPPLVRAAETPTGVPAGTEHRGQSAGSWAASGNLRSLRLAIEDLNAAFGPRYPRAGEYLARLAALEKRGAGDDPAGRAELAALQREALLANPLLGFDKLLLVRREDKGDLGLTPNWGGKTDIGKTGYDNEIMILSPVSPDGNLTTVYRPADREFVGDLDLHWNADRLLFTMPGGQGAGPWNVYELALDETGTVPICRNGPRPTSGRCTAAHKWGLSPFRPPVPVQVTPDWPGVDSDDGCYLPDGRILFSSTAAQTVCPCWGRYAPRTGRPTCTSWIAAAAGCGNSASTRTTIGALP